METLKFIKKEFDVDIKQPVVKIDINRAKGFTALLRDLGFKKGVEVGTLKGWYANWMCHVIKGVKLFLVDPYIAYDEYSEGRTQKDLDSFEDMAKTRLARFDVEFIKKTSMEAVRNFNDESLDFVFIDANHDYKWVKEDIEAWSKKVKKGGIVSGHDYSTFHAEVRKAVDEHIKANKIKPLFLIGDKVWFYVKT